MQNHWHIVYLEYTEANFRLCLLVVSDPRNRNHFRIISDYILRIHSYHEILQNKLLQSLTYPWCDSLKSALVSLGGINLKEPLIKT